MSCYSIGLSSAYLQEPSIGPRDGTVKPRLETVCSQVLDLTTDIISPPFRWHGLIIIVDTCDTCEVGFKASWINAIRLDCQLSKL